MKTVINLVLNGADIVTGAALLGATDGGSISGASGFTAGVAKMVDLANIAVNHLDDVSDCAEAVVESSVPWLKTLSLSISLAQLFMQLADCLTNEYYVVR